MLTSIVVPLTSVEDATLPHHLGRGNYAALLSEINTVAPKLAKQIHDSDGPKPVTCSGLLNATTDRSGTHIKAGARYFCRVTSLTPATSQALQDIFGLCPTPLPATDLHTPNVSDRHPANWTILDHRFQVPSCIQCRSRISETGPRSPRVFPCKTTARCGRYVADVRLQSSVVATRIVSPFPQLTVCCPS